MAAFVSTPVVAYSTTTAWIAAPAIGAGDFAWLEVGSQDGDVRAVAAFRGDRLIINPLWPESLGALRMPIHYRGYRMHLTITGRSAELSVDPTEHPPIEIECRGKVKTLTPGTFVRFD